MTIVQTTVSACRSITSHRSFLPRLYAGLSLRLEDGRCGSGKQAAHPRVCLCNKNKTTFKERVWSGLFSVLNSWLPLNHFLINTVAMASKLSIIQEAASLPLVGSSIISTLWTSWPINASYNSPFWRAVTVHSTSHVDSWSHLLFPAGLCCPFKAPAHQLCVHWNTEGIAASIMKTCPLTPLSTNQMLLWRQNDDVDL